MKGGKLYVGIDLGDRTYSVNAVKSQDNSNHPVRLPGQQGNTPILSAVGRRKDGEYELLREYEEYDPAEFETILANFKRKPETLQTGTQEMVNYETGIKEMLSLTLGNALTCRAICDLAIECEEIVFCIGYPTNWTEKDVSFFHNILNCSILGNTQQLHTLYGKPIRVLEERESTAAFIYARTYKEKLGIDKNTCVLVLDFGSSTVNVTALTIGKRNTLYNSGHNFFGGRMVDCLIADYYISQLTNQERSLIKALDECNRGIATSLILLEACTAKEKLMTSKTVKLVTSIFPNRSVRLTGEILDELLEKPLASVAKKFHLISESEQSMFGTRSWKKILTDYLAWEKKQIFNAGIQPGLVIAVGGGSLFSYTRRICEELFTNVEFFDAGNATSIISKGLALAGKREDRSKEFNRDVENFLTKKMPKLIRAEIPALANAVSESVADYICDKIIIPQFINWKNGVAGYSTLNVTSKKITEACAGAGFSNGIQKDPKIQEKIRDWSVNKLGVSVAGELSSICSKYNVRGFTLDKLNIMKTPTISIDGGDVLGSAFDFVGTVVGVVIGFIAANLSGTALILILEILYLLIPGLAMMIIEIIMLIPGGPVILAGIVGVAAFKLIRRNWDEIRDIVMERICNAVFPNFLRNAVSENRIRNSIDSKRGEISQKIKNSISSGKNADDIAKQISDSISKQISLKLDEIRFALESK